MLKNYTFRTAKLISGLFLYALGCYLNIQANIGLAPWEAFSMGVSMKTNIRYGDIVVITGIFILILDVILKEKIGIGTILNTLLIGKFVDLIAYIDLIPEMQSFWSGLLMLLLGQVVLCFGSYLYISAAMGCGPRDSLMVALGKRFSRVPIGIIRAVIEGSVLLIGWLLGAKVGIGTIISVFGIGFILQFTFKLLRFNVTAVHHESVADTIKIIRERRR